MSRIETSEVGGVGVRATGEDIDIALGLMEPAVANAVASGAFGQMRQKNKTAKAESDKHNRPTASTPKTDESGNKRKELPPTQPKSTQQKPILGDQRKSEWIPTTPVAVVRPHTTGGEPRENANAPQRGRGSRIADITQDTVTDSVDTNNNNNNNNNNNGNDNNGNDNNAGRKKVTLRGALEQFLADDDYWRSGGGPQTDIGHNWLGVVTILCFAIIILDGIWTLAIFILNCDLLNDGVIRFLEDSLGMPYLLTATNGMSIIVCLVTFGYLPCAAVTTWYMFNKTFRVSVIVGVAVTSLNLIFCFICSGQLDDANERVQNGLQASFEKFSVEGVGGSDDDLLWNFVQLKWDCCGVDSYSDWRSSNWLRNTNTRVITLTYNTTRLWPTACCKDADEPADVDFLGSFGVRVNPYSLSACYDPIYNSNTYVNTQGCESSVQGFIRYWAGTMVALYFLQFLFLLISLIFVVLIKLKGDKLQSKVLPNLVFMEKTRTQRVEPKDRPASHDPETDQSFIAGSRNTTLISNQSRSVIVESGRNTRANKNSNWMNHL
ncbi:uncharacterized protein LOC134857310 isoform X2 [Symsagittifera roscoffensis]|uniref:uncharacterized protein LOC134857310 isoform X2 n=1 Tax=Symsagittifera roscoffensis TaxID=84072 RepID=UPI00307BBD80